MSFDFTVKEFILGNGTGTPTFQFYRRGFNLNDNSGSTPSWQDIILSGNGSLTLTNAKANGINYVKLFGNAEQRNLPSGHTQLEYVYMTSGSFVKVEDLLISSGYRIEYEFQTTTLSSSLRNYLGGRASGVSAGGGFRLSKLASGGTTLNRVVLYGFEDGTEYYDPTTRFQPNTRYKYTYDNGVCTLESGGSVVSTQTFTVTDNTSTKWGINSYVSNNDYWQTDTDGVYGYSLKVWNPQGELVMDLVPDLTSSNVVCYYDMVTGNIREASAGTFEAGTIAPTPTTPVNIISNNGAIKYSANMANVNEQTALVGYYISSSGVVTADPNNWIYQDFIPVKPSTTYTLTMSSSVYYVTISEYSTTDDSGFIRRNAGGSGDNTTLTITTSSTANYIRFGTNIDRSEMTLDRVLAIDWMLNVGDTMAYQPYVEGGIYTDGTVETVDVSFCDDTIDGQGTFVAPSSSTTTRIYKAFGQLPDGEYTVSITGGFEFIFQYKDSIEGYTQYGNIGTWTTNGVYNVDNTGYYYGIAIRYPNNRAIRPSDFNGTITIIKTGNSATAEMLLKVGDYQDVQSVLDGEVTRKVGVKVLDGTENITTDTYGGYRRFVFQDSVGSYSETQEVVCSHYIFRPSGLREQPNSIFLASSGKFVIYISTDQTFTTVAKFSTWLATQYQAGTPVTIVYPLATATTESVPHQHLSIQAGTNIVEITQASIDNLELEVSYKGKEGE